MMLPPLPTHARATASVLTTKFEHSAVDPAGVTRVCAYSLAAAGSSGDHRKLMQVELLWPVAAAEEEGAARLEEADDIGDVAVLVDASGAGSAFTRECPGLRLSTMYFAIDPTGETRVCAYSLAAVGSSMPLASPAIASGRASPLFPSPAGAVGPGPCHPPLPPSRAVTLAASHPISRRRRRARSAPLAATPASPRLSRRRDLASARCCAAGARKPSHPYGPQIQGQTCLYLVFLSPNL
uniref:DUF295 domain-containing protein n=1 Tax=Oryza nivara TaxID=4536 RepID=A0A0E0G4B8_ORYNI